MPQLPNRRFDLREAIVRRLIPDNSIFWSRAGIPVAASSCRLISDIGVIGSI